MFAQRLMINLLMQVPELQNLIVLSILHIVQQYLEFFLFPPFHLFSIIQLFLMSNFSPALWEIGEGDSNRKTVYSNTKVISWYLYYIVIQAYEPKSEATSAISSLSGAVTKRIFFSPRTYFPSCVRKMF